MSKPLLSLFLKGYQTMLEFILLTVTWIFMLLSMLSFKNKILELFEMYSSSLVKKEDIKLDLIRINRLLDCIEIGISHYHKHVTSMLSELNNNNKENLESVSKSSQKNVKN
jgi:hypothetical protein